MREGAVATCQAQPTDPRRAGPDALTRGGGSGWWGRSASRRRRGTSWRTGAPQSAVPHYLGRVIASAVQSVARVRCVQSLRSQSPPKSPPRTILPLLPTTPPAATPRACLAAIFRKRNVSPPSPPSSDRKRLRRLRRC